MRTPSRGSAIAPPGSGPTGEGDQLTVAWGKEGFQPVQFHGMDVGPFYMTTQLRPGESATEAYARLRKQLKEVAKLEFEAKLPEYLERIKQVRAKVRNGS